MNLIALIQWRENCSHRRQARIEKECGASVVLQSTAKTKANEIQCSEWAAVR